MSLLDRTKAVGDSDDRLKILIHGAPGTGKTTLGASFAETGARGLYIDFLGELGSKSISGLYGDAVQHIQIKNVDELVSLHAELRADTTFDWVMIDSMTAAQSMIARYLMKKPEDAMEPFSKGRKFDQQTWGSMLDHFTELVVFYYNLASASESVAKPKHVIFTAQSRIWHDDLTKSEKTDILIRGSGKEALTAAADYIIYTFVDEVKGTKLDGSDRTMRHLVRMGPHPGIRTKLRRSVMASPLPPVVGEKGRLTLPKFLKLLSKP